MDPGVIPLFGRRSLPPAPLPATPRLPEAEKRACLEAIERSPPDTDAARRLAEHYVYVNDTQGIRRLAEHRHVEVREALETAMAPPPAA